MIRMKFSRKITAASLCLGLGLALAGCSSDSNEFTSSDFSSIGGGGVVSDVGFYVKVKQDVENPVTTYMHKFGDFNSECSVDSTEIAKDIQCMVNIREFDLNFFGLTLEVNLPRNMCKFFREAPYWYYNFEPGTGPASLSVSYDPDTGDVTACSIDGAAGTFSGSRCQFPDNEGYVTSGGKVVCAYDYSEDQGPNCCAGEYTLTLNPVGEESQTRDGDYGGKHGQCLGGPTTTNSWPRTQSGYPVYKVYNVNGAGINREYKINSNIELFGDSWNVFGANFYDWTNYPNISIANIPTAVRGGTYTGNPNDNFALDRSGDPILSGNPAYEYQCYDESSEMKHRIRVYINEWDTNEQFASYLSSQGASGSPDTPGLDGVNCDIGESVTGNCNDFYEWDSAPGVFPGQQPL